MPVAIDRPLRVILADDRLGYEKSGLHGGGRLMIDRTRALVERGLHVRAVIRSESLRAVAEAEGLPFVFLGRAQFDPRMLTDLTALIRRERIDVAHLQGLSTSTFGRLAAKLTGIPSVVQVHADYRLSVKGYPWYVRAVDHALAPMTDRVLLVSEALRSYTVDRMGFRSDQIQVLHSPVDRRRFRQPSARQREEARAQLNLPGDALVVVTVGRLDRLKGSDLQIACWGDVVARVPSARLLVVGDGPLRGELEDRVATEAWGSTVQILGQRTDVESILWAADVAVLSSRYEGLPLVALEAMSTGLPMLATAVGGIPEVIHHGQNGLLVPPEDAQALGNALISLLSDAALRHALGSGASRFMVEYDLPSHAARLEEIYRSVIERKRGKR